MPCPLQNKVPGKWVVIGVFLCCGGVFVFVFLFFCETEGLRTRKAGGEFQLKSESLRDRGTRGPSSTLRQRSKLILYPLLPSSGLDLSEFAEAYPFREEQSASLQPMKEMLFLSRNHAQPNIWPAHDLVSTQNQLSRFSERHYIDINLKQSNCNNKILCSQIYH